MFSSLMWTSSHSSAEGAMAKSVAFSEQHDFLHHDVFG